MLQSIESQRVGHDFATEQYTVYNILENVLILCKIYLLLSYQWVVFIIILNPIHGTF